MIAINTLGQSDESAGGSGAVLATYPDKPTDLVESSRTVSTLGLSWSVPAFTGGILILDYSIIYDVAGNTKIISGVTETEYVVKNLTPGEDYQFTI